MLFYLQKYIHFVIIKSMKHKDINKTLAQKKFFKFLLIFIIIACPIMIVFGGIFWNVLAMRAALIISIPVLIISLIALPFVNIIYSETLAMKKMHDLITKDNILLISELSAIFGNGDVYSKTLINKLLSYGYLKNYKYKDQNELKYIEEINVKNQ